jgi:hypothetical protein
LDPVPLDPASDPVALGPVILNPVLDSAPLGPVLDPVALVAALDPVPPDIPSAGPVPEHHSSPVFGPATVVQLASPVDKPPDEISVDLAFDSAPAAAPKWAPDKSPTKVIKPGSVPCCASQRQPVPLSTAQHRSAPVSACLPACLFGLPPCQPVGHDDAHHRPRLRSSRRLLARNPPAGNSRRLPCLRQSSQKPPNKNFHCFGRMPTRESPPQPESLACLTALSLDCFVVEHEPRLIVNN